MIVYGDHPRPTTLAALDAEAAARLDTARATRPGLARHTALVAAFLAAAEATRARADADFAHVGYDRRTPESDVAMAALVRLARATRVSWRSRFRRTPVPRIEPPAHDPTPVTTKPAEGFAFYALYPEAVLDALEPLSPVRDLAIVGLRGIGTALAALAAAATRSRRSPITVRPTGHPFARTLSVDPALARDVAAAATALVADEGPGLSGSSMAAAVDWLGQAGLSAKRVHLLTSHAGPPGAMADDRIRALFAACPRHVVSFEASIAPHLPGWVADLLGQPLTAWRDVSGGAWADAVTPTDPPRERLKFIASTASGRYHVKFAGLGAVGEAKLARARALGSWVPPPIGLVHGFLVERWIERASSASPTPTEVAGYLATRARPPEGPGASPADLIEMARANIGEALGPEAVAAFDSLAPVLETLPSRAIAIDNRLHEWEWVRDAHGRLFKADALDHCEAHDLIGHQDIAWDVAGAAIELGLDPATLARACGANTRLVAIHLLIYPAFQLGLWTMAGHPRAAFYAAHLRAALTPVGRPRAAAGR